MCCKQERKDGTKVKAEVSLKFKAPTDRNCLLELKAVLQSTKTGCTQHKGILLLFLSPSTPCPQTGCHTSNNLKEETEIHHTSKGTYVIKNRLECQERRKYGMSLFQLGIFLFLFFTFSNFQRPLRFAKLLHCF